ncbi:uncharacterized protein LOC131657477 [Vicia villosa]|uniref:uncharacterized protein LOC131657477 n=1 Tax=Vicia villosa TaxID=3911 RepID=UPI00273AE8F5|nr:uncharacterized protein LOC131657477 [Vicia villosa]
MVAGRNDDAIAEELTMLGGAIGPAPNVNVGNIEEDEFRALGNLWRNNPPILEGEHEPDKAQKVQFDICMLEKEAEDWWEDVHGKKEVKFLELKQGNGTIAEYAVRFQELIKYCPYYNTANVERSKCLKFVNCLRPEIKKAIVYQQISCFAELVNKSRIYDEDCRESAAHYKKSSGGGAPTSIRCYMCGVEGHRVSECTSAEVKCFKCGKPGHKANECRGGACVTCYNCGLEDVTPFIDSYDTLHQEKSNFSSNQEHT